MIQTDFPGANKRFSWTDPEAFRFHTPPIFINVISGEVFQAFHF